jgi:hypothetical protein
MADDAVVVASRFQEHERHPRQGEDLRFRPVDSWERRAMELAAALRKSNRELWEAIDELGEYRSRAKDDPDHKEDNARLGQEVQPRQQQQQQQELTNQEQTLRQQHGHDLSTRLELQRRHHVQEMAFHLERQRQQYALDTAALLEAQRTRHAADLAAQATHLQEGHAKEMARNLELHAEQHMAEQQRRLCELKGDCEARLEGEVARLTQAGQREVQLLEQRIGQQAQLYAQALSEQKKGDALARAAEVVGLMAQLKEADDRRRKEKRELGSQLTGQIEEARRVVEEVRRERDEERGKWTTMQRELEEATRGLCRLAELEVRCENETRAKETAQEELAEARKQKEASASKGAQRAAAKHARLQKEHNDLLAMHKQTTEAARELRLRMGKLELAKEDNEREIKERVKTYGELQKVHDRVTDALTMARQEMLAVKERFKDAPSQFMYDAVQKEVAVLQGMLKVSGAELTQARAENDTIRDAFCAQDKDGVLSALYNRSVLALKSAHAELTMLRQRLAEAELRLDQKQQQQQQSIGEAQPDATKGLRLLVLEANQQVAVARAEAKAAREALDGTDRGKQLREKMKEVVKLHGVLAMLITEVNNPPLIEHIMATLSTDGAAIVKATANFKQSCAKKPKTGV